LFDGFIHARAGIGEPDGNIPPARDVARRQQDRRIGVFRGDQESASGGHRVTRVDHHIQNHLLEMGAIDQRGPGGPQIEPGDDVFADQPGKNAAQFLDGAVRTQRPGPGDFLAAEGEELPGQASRALRRFDDPAGVAHMRIFLPETRLQQFSVTADHAQQIVEVVGHASGEAAQGFHFLRLKKLRFEFALLGPVEHHRENTLSLADADEVGKADGEMLSARGIQELHLFVLHRTVEPQLAEKLLAFRFGTQQPDVHRASADDLISGEPQQVQQVFVDVEKNTFRRHDGAAHGTVAKDGGKALFRLAQGNFGILALGDVDDRAFHQSAALGAMQA